jgi:hypothetical protein
MVLMQAYYDGDVVMGLVCLNVTDAVEITTIDCQVSAASTRSPRSLPLLCRRRRVLLLLPCLACSMAAPCHLPGMPSLQLRGFEKTHWTETHTHGSGSNSHTTTEYHGATVAFLDVTHPLAGAHRRLEPGQYQWQIAFALPQGVPSSFLISSGGTK